MSKMCQCFHPPGFIWFICHHCHKRSTFLFQSKLFWAQSCWFAICQRRAEKGWVVTFWGLFLHMLGLFRLLLMTLYVHRDDKDYWGRGAQGVHLDLHTAPELCSSSQVQCCFASTDTIRTVSDGEPRHPSRLSRSSRALNSSCSFSSDVASHSQRHKVC